MCVMEPRPLSPAGLGSGDVCEALSTADPSPSPSSAMDVPSSPTSRPSVSSDESSSESLAPWEPLADEEPPCRARRRPAARPDNGPLRGPRAGGDSRGGVALPAASPLLRASSAETSGAWVSGGDSRDEDPSADSSAAAAAAAAMAWRTGPRSWSADRWARPSEAPVSALPRQNSSSLDAVASVRGSRGEAAGSGTGAWPADFRVRFPDVSLAAGSSSSSSSAPSPTRWGSMPAALCRLRRAGESEAVPSGEANAWAGEVVPLISPGASLSSKCSSP